MKHCILYFVLTGLFMPGAYAQKFDASFGNEGWASHNLDTVEGVAGLLVQKDNKILVSGGTADHPVTGQVQPYVMRINVDGSRDNNFGDKGITKLFFDAEGVAGSYLAADHSSGKIYLAGSREDATGPFYLARLNSNGSPDNSFGVSGILTDSAGTGTDNEHVYAIAIQADGKILLAGYRYSFSPKSNFVWVIRYHTDGSPDSSFGVNGRVLTRIDNAYPRRMLVMNDGRILIGGYYQHPVQLKQDFFLLRLKSDGSPDNTFGSNPDATVIIGLQDKESVTGMGLQSDGSIIVGGPCGNGYTQFNLMKVNANGTGDINFGTLHTSTGNWGYTRLELDKYIDHFVADIAIMPDDKILLGGFMGYYRLCAYRFKANGHLDSSFGRNGLVDSSFGPNRLNCYAAAYNHSTGRFYVAGSYSFVDDNSNSSYVAAVKVGDGDNHSGISSLKTAGSLKLYPNPAAGALQLETPQHITTIEVYSVAGQLQLSSAYTADSDFDISSLPPGMYILKAISQNSIETASFQVLR